MPHVFLNIMWPSGWSRTFAIYFDGIIALSYSDTLIIILTYVRILLRDIISFQCILNVLPDIVEVSSQTSFSIISDAAVWWWFNEWNLETLKVHFILILITMRFDKKFTLVVGGIWRLTCCVLLNLSFHYLHYYCFVYTNLNSTLNEYLMMKGNADIFNKQSRNKQSRL